MRGQYVGCFTGGIGRLLPQNEGSYMRGQYQGHSSGIGYVCGIFIYIIGDNMIY